MIRNLLAAAASLALVATPVVAQAAERQPSPVSKKEDIAGVSTALLLIGLAVVVGVIILIADDNNHHHPASP